MFSLETTVKQVLDHHSVMMVALAIAGGVFSDFLPCTIAMLPVLVGYIGGYSEQSRWLVFQQVALFIVGVALVMTLLGVAASMLGVAFGTLIGSGWYYAVGILAIVIALNMLGILHIPLPQFITGLPKTNAGRILTPLILGLSFGAASSPCGTPFLAGILAFISQEKNILLGGTSLFFYALGQGVLLLVVGMFTGLLKHMATLRQVGSVMTRLSAGLFIVVGILSIAQASGHLGDLMRFLHLL